VRLFTETKGATEVFHSLVRVIKSLGQSRTGMCRGRVERVAIV
jgi:hypothetical protein